MSSPQMASELTADYFTITYDFTTDYFTVRTKKGPILASAFFIFSVALFCRQSKRRKPNLNWTSILIFVKYADPLYMQDYIL